MKTARQHRHRRPRPRSYRRAPGQLQAQRGAATLLLVLGLVLLATLASAWSSRAVLTDLLASQAMVRAAQARLAAQAAMAGAEAALLQPDAIDPLRQPFARQTRPCPDDLQGPTWQCSTLPLPEAGMLPGWQAQTLLARELVQAPQVWQVRARASSGDAVAGLRQSVFMPVLAPAPVSTPAAALVLNGCISEAAGSTWQICPPGTGTAPCSGSATGPAVYSHFVPDTDRNGSIGNAERQACLALPPGNLPGGGALASADAPASRSPCNRAVWRSVFGDTTPSQLQAWSEAQERQGLNTLSQPPRSIYWVDSPADWNRSLGSAQAPVLLVFSAQACAGRCPRIASGVHIHGTVYADAGCDDERLRGWQAGWVEGLVALEAGLPQPGGSSRLWASSNARQAFTLHWPEGIDSRRVQRVQGSRWEGLP